MAEAHLNNWKKKKGGNDENSEWKKKEETKQRRKREKDEPALGGKKVHEAKSYCWTTIQNLKTLNSQRKVTKDLVQLTMLTLADLTARSS